MLVVCDVDGTLVDRQKQLSEATVAAVGRLRAAGIRFTIISARPMSGMIPLAERLALDEPMGAFNGGVVFRRDGAVSEHHVIPAEVARGVFDLVGDAPVDRWVFADDRWYASTDRGEHVAHERIASAQEPTVRADFGDLLDRADKITFVSDDAALLGKLAEKKAGDRIRRLTSADRARQHSRDNGGRRKTVVANDTSGLVNDENCREALLLIGESACLQPVIKRRVPTGELGHVMRGGERFGSR